MSILFLLLAAAVAADDPNWPQWRGPSRNGVSTETGLPLEWGATDNLLWKTAIEGRGHSSPVVWGNRVFLTTDIEGEPIEGASAPKHIRDGEVYLHPDSQSGDRRHTLKVVALEAETGALLWSRTAHDGRVFDNRHRINTYASPTAVSDGERVYAYFGSEGLFAYDFDGALVWRLDFGDLPSWGHGQGTSPLLYRELLVLQVDRNQGEGSFIAAFDRATGREVWRSPRNERINYSSPLLVETRTGAQIVTTSYDVVISYDPSTGRELWRSEGFLGNAVPTPVASDTTVFVVSGYPDKLTRAIRIPQGNAELPEVLWEYKKGSGYTPSPLLYGGYLYLVSDKGVLTCLDPESGTVVYEGGRFPVPSFVRASPVAWEDKILLAGEEGDLVVVQAGSSHKVLAVNSLGEPIIASPAIAAGRLYLRGASHIYAVGARGR
jgi:outer membrane protein assembly factor BamB